MTDRIEKTDAEWRAQLTPAQYKVARRGGTERAFTGPNWDTKDAGIYHCVCCDEPLFASDTKFESGTGWPSFFDPLSQDVIGLKEDRSIFSVRTEVVCAKCDGHLGHVFDDGPPPTGLRYCLNGTALRLATEDDTA